MTGNDLEIGIKTAPIEAEIAEKGEVAIEARIFNEIVRRLNGESVTIETDDKFAVTILSGTSEFKIMGQSGDDFPSLPEVEQEKIYSMEQAKLRDMIRQTIFAVADSNAKPIHQGSLFKIENNTLDVVSVDGYRLALRREAIQFDGELDFVVPGKTLSEVLKLLRDDDSDVEICPSRRHILFKSDIINFKGA